MFLIDQQKLDHSAQNLKVFSRLDIEFHSAIHTIAGNAMCRTIIRDVRMFVDRLRNLSLHRPTDLPEIVADHLAIATAMAKGDPDGAERAMNRHMDRVHRVAKTLIAQYPEYFEKTDA
jgi:DNA-binding GntR family transcriptional regulator